MRSVFALLLLVASISHAEDLLPTESKFEPFLDFGVYIDGSVDQIYNEVRFHPIKAWKLFAPRFKSKDVHKTCKAVYGTEYLMADSDGDAVSDIPDRKLKKMLKDNPDIFDYIQQLKNVEAKEDGTAVTTHWSQHGDKYMSGTAGVLLGGVATAAFENSGDKEEGVRIDNNSGQIALNNGDGSSEAEREDSQVAQGR